MVYPRRCPVCDDAVDLPGKLICSGCAGGFKEVAEPYCLRCGRPLKNADAGTCTECRGRDRAFAGGRATYVYDDELKQSIYRFKYGGRREYADHYADAMAGKLGGWMLSLKPDALIPVPIHKSRLKERGYDQAVLIAERLGKKLDIPVRNDVLARSAKTRVQKELGAGERQNNLKKALKICSDVVKLKNVILIDDIYTTGSTMDAAASVLKDAGAGGIYFAVLGIADKY
ncbi:MAG: ComF family protein [Lachnospiraceae bacterium]|nr:ComF family protein [Lachnospiraceae bacterium]